MRILIAGATGVLGRATLPHLVETHDVVGLTRTRAKVRLLRSLGADGVACDVYDAEKLLRLVQARRPQVVVNFLTDLSSGDGEANNRLRRIGGANLVAAAEAAGAQRLIVESVDFPLGDAAAKALAEMEARALGSSMEVLVLRFGRFWGPSTRYPTPPEPPRIHVNDAGAQAAGVIESGSPGIHVVKSSTSA